MHPNPVFHTGSDTENLDFAAKRGFGVLSINGADAPLLAHVPFCIDCKRRVIEAHLMRSNPIVRELGEPKDAVLAVTGPDGYISPDWYGVIDQVPTWNYVAVHIRGFLSKRPDEELDGVLDRLSLEMESRISGKKPWKTAKMDQDIYGRMKRQIVPVEMTIANVDATWKLSQNKPAEAVDGAIGGIKGAGIGQETDDLIVLMAQARAARVTEE